MQAGLSLALLLVAGGREAIDFITEVATSPADLPLLVAVTLWSGIIVNAVAPFLQVGGQQAIGPTRAQVLYASQPLWASLLALIFLGETVGGTGVAGGGLFLTAVFIAATAPEPDANCEAVECEV